MKVKCPYCGKPALFKPENPFRPFCSERCKLIDLGQWAEERYAIPVKPSADIDADEPAPDDPNDEFEGPENLSPVPGQRSKH